MRIAPFAIAAAIATAFTSVGTSAELTPELLSVCKAVFTDGSRDIYNYSSDVTRAAIISTESARSTQALIANSTESVRTSIHQATLLGAYMTSNGRRTKTVRNSKMNSRFFAHKSKTSSTCVKS